MLNYQRVNLSGLAAAPPMADIPINSSVGRSNQNNRAPKTDHVPH